MKSENKWSNQISPSRQARGFPSLMGRHATCRYPSQESSKERHQDTGSINQLCLERAKIQESRNRKANNAFTVGTLAYVNALEE